MTDAIPDLDLLCRCDHPLGAHGHLVDGVGGMCCFCACQRFGTDTHAYTHVACELRHVDMARTILKQMAGSVDHFSVNGSIRTLTFTAERDRYAVQFEAEDECDLGMVATVLSDALWARGGDPK